MYKYSDVKILKKYHEGLDNAEPDADTKQKIPVITVVKIITAALLIGLIPEMMHGVVFSNYEKQFSLKYEIYALAVFAVIFYAVRKIKFDWRSKRIFPDSDIFIRYMTDKVKDYFGASGTYDSNSGFPDGEIKKFNYFTDDIAAIKGKYLICGKYKGTDFRLAYEDIRRKHVYNDSEGYTCVEYLSMFSGYIISVPFRSGSIFPVGIRSKTREELIGNMKKKNRFFKSNNSENYKTQNDNFNSLFSVFSDNKEHIGYVLTSDLTEKITALYSYINDFENGSEQNISNIFNGIYIYIEYNRIYLGISSKCDFFHFSGVKADDSGFEELSDKINKAFGYLEFILDAAVSLQSSGFK